MKSVTVTLIPILLSACALDMDILTHDHFWEASAAFHAGDYARFTKKRGVDFKIMALTDTHIGGWKYDPSAAVEKTYAMVRKAVNEHQPDLLVLNGDNSVGNGFANMTWAWSLIAFLDSLDTPYALVMGNHDGAGFGDMLNDNREEVVARIFAAGKNSLFACGPVNVHGKGNYGINIVDENGDFVYSLIMLDSNKDYLRENQVAWYQWYVSGASGAAGRTVKSLVFFHIPLPEMLTAKAALEATDPEAAADMFKGGICEQTRNTGMFTAVKNLGSTTHLFFGHDHPNRGSVAYNGVQLVYCLKTGYCEPDGSRTGVTLISLDDDAKVAVAFKRY
ncbi:MAG: metallophosphoesterase [Treponema sp.]|jgi:hypothetical protein|nr:metallophosphoesterase [Treponema sp.]